MVAEPDQTPRRQRDGWVALGMTVSATSAAVSSFSGLRLLAEVAGWAPIMAWLFPLTVDAYAMTATRVWLAASTRSERARRFARTNAVGAILLSLCGNATYHLIAAGLVAVTWPIVLGVGAVPPLVLGLVSHLAVLRTQADPAGPPQRSRTEAAGAEAHVTMSAPVVVPSPVEVVRQAPPGPTYQSYGVGSRQATEDDQWPAAQAADASEGGAGLKPAPVRTEADRRYRSEDELLAAARTADTAHRATHGGRAMSRDALRRELQIGGARASALHRRLKEEHTSPAPIGATDDGPADVTGGLAEQLLTRN
jgi:hypothetical protein